jgi:glycyl-tRNA synthetase (class II)
MKEKDLDKVIEELKIKAPETNNELSQALPFNLMFETLIGPTGT